MQHQEEIEEDLVYDLCLENQLGSSSLVSG